MLCRVFGAVFGSPDVPPVVSGGFTGRGRAALQRSPWLFYGSLLVFWLCSPVIIIELFL